MSKAFRVALYEYTRHVLRKRFLFALLSVPFFITVVMLVSVFAVVLSTDYSPIGYVDQSGFLAQPLPAPKVDSLFSRQVEIRSFSTEADTRAALEAGQIQAYYVLPPAYLQTSDARLVYMKEPSGEVQNQFVAFLRENLLAGQPAEIARRLSEGSFPTIQSQDGSRQVSGNAFLNILIPMIAGILFMIMILTTGGYLLQAVVEEKENRTMEIIVTSVSPDQLIAGKILGNISVGLTQLLAWLIFGLAILLFGRGQLGWSQSIDIGPDYVLILLVTMLPAFVMIAAIMTALGATVTETREAQQISGFFTLPIVAPYWFSSTLMSNPNGPLALGLSYFPLTAPVTISLRAGFTQIPPLQLAANIGVLIVFAILATWLAARAFRLGMLSYGKRLPLRRLFQKIA